jgi:hypothetical protein
VAARPIAAMPQCVNAPGPPRIDASGPGRDTLPRGVFVVDACATSCDRDPHSTCERGDTLAKSRNFRPILRAAPRERFALSGALPGDRQ